MFGQGGQPIALGPQIVYHCTMKESLEQSNMEVGLKACHNDLAKNCKIKKIKQMGEYGRDNTKITKTIALNKKCAIKKQRWKQTYMLE
jgi:hypothetical protein